MNVKHTHSNRALYIENASNYIRIIEESFHTVKYEYNLNLDDQEFLVDWVLINILKAALSDLGVKITGHYRSDEAKLVEDAINPKQYESIRLSLRKRFRHLNNTDIKVLITGSEMLIAAKYNYES